MPSKAKSVSPSKNFNPCIGLTGRPAAAAALQEIQGLGGSFFLNLLFMWNISPARMMWRLRILTEEECIIGQAGLVAVARKGGFVAGGAVGFTGLEDEGGLAVEADVFGDGLSVAQVGEEREGEGRDLRRSRRRRPTEIRLLKSMVRPSERFCIQDGGGAIAVEVF